MSLSRYAILVLFTAAATLAVVGLLAPGAAPVRGAILFGALLGGMIGRMALMLAAVVAGVLLLGLPRLPLVIALLSYFTLFLVMELTVQHRHARRPAETR
jgi:hypothetical protein